MPTAGVPTAGGEPMVGSHRRSVARANCAASCAPRCASPRGEPMVGWPRRSVACCSCAPSCASRCAPAWRAYGWLAQEVGGPEQLCLQLCHRCAPAWRAYGWLAQQVGGPSSCAPSCADLRVPTNHRLAALVEPRRSVRTTAVHNPAPGSISMGLAAWEHSWEAHSSHNRPPVPTNHRLAQRVPPRGGH